MGADFFLTAPQDRPSATIIDAINEGVALGYEQGYLRKSIVDDPLNERKNTGTNTPAIIYMNLVPGDRLRLRLMLKGGGCENRSQVKMLKPADGEEGVKDFIVDVVRQAGADACPPFVVGVGIGGDFEMSAILAKKALLRSMDSGHENPYYAQIERELLNRINDLGIGPQGMGGRTTALGVLIETYPCHIASLPVAVNIECHSHRHAEITI
jgi:fumarate hydratase subunit alpha